MDEHNKEQQERLMNGRGKANGAVENGSFKKFLYNRDRGTCLGRTAKSWVQILGFYLVFYSLLMGFWIACLSAFLSTLDSMVPRYYGKGTIIGINPGVGYQPWLIENPDTTLIKYNVHEKSSYKKYVDTLDKYLTKYKNTTATRLCTGDQSNAQLFSDGGAKAETLPGQEIVKSCRFDLNQFMQRGCGRNNEYGFADGKPCVVLSLNRLIGWKPIDYAPDSVPEEIRNRYKPNFVTFNCDGTSDFDKEHIGNVTYIPEAGIDGKYYPYAVMPNYQQPIAMIKFDNLPRNKLVLVECRAYAQNIEFDITSKLGMVNFELLIEDNIVQSPAEHRR